VSTPCLWPYEEHKKNTKVTSTLWYRKFQQFVQLKGLADRSQDVYLNWARQIDRHFPGEITTRLKADQVLDFLLHLQVDRKLAGSTVNQAVAALRNLYRDHLDHDWNIWNKIKIRRVEPLPHVLTRQEVALLLSTFRQSRFRAFFTVIYHCGLRLSEASHIKPKHIDGSRLVIRIANGKGGKSREVPITPELLRRLRRFWKAHRNPEWLFPGLTRRWKSSQMTKAEAMGACPHPMSSATVQQAMKVAVAETGLLRTHEKISSHTLRHSYATHLLDAGASVRQVSAYLGHSSLKQTMVYLHLTEISDGKAREALYTLPGL
jgi:integrase/recombinase XerD